tara:strand:+ start:1654 stop:2889 length:1236 start_codon:yes stop_codon:yes gene_type:complete
MIRFLLALTALMTTVQATTFPLDQASPENSALFERIHPLLLAEARTPVPPLSESNESWFWVNSHKIAQLLDAYEYSGDTVFLDAFVERMTGILQERYIHPTNPGTWSGWYHYQTQTHSYMVIHAGIVYYQPALRFVEFVTSDPALNEKYGLLAKIWLEDITQVSIPGWDRRGCWKEMSEDEGWYVKITQKPHPESHELIPEDDGLAGTSFAYNKLHEMLKGFLIAYRITGNEAFLDRVEKCARVFRRHWRVDDRHAEWYYREILGPWDYKSGRMGEGDTYFKGYIHPKGGYYSTDVGYVVDCYNHGIQFTRADIEKLIQTNVEFMYRGEDADPEYTNIDGSYKIYEEKSKQSWGQGSLWTSLAQFSPRIREMWKARIDRLNPGGYGYGRSMICYLLATSRPITWTPRHTKE